MATTGEIEVAFRNTLGRNPTGEEISAASGFSAGQLNDPANIRRAAGISTPEDLARQQQGLRREAIAPAVSSLREGIPETQERFEAARGRLEAEREPLIQRYDNIINDIANTERQVTESATLRTSNELGRRGISSRAGVYEQELGRVLEPLTERFGVQRTGVNLERESDIRELDNMIAQLTGQETGAVRDIRNAIAQLQASSGGQGISDALSLFKLQEESKESALDRQLNEITAQLQYSGGDGYSFETLGSGSTGYIIDSNGNIVQTIQGKGSGGGDGAIDYESLLAAYIAQQDEKQPQQRNALDLQAAFGSGGLTL